MLFEGTAALTYTVRLFSIVCLTLWLRCVLHALNGKPIKLPLIGTIAEKLSMK